jgi:hypothetical protein
VLASLIKVIDSVDSLFLDRRNTMEFISENGNWELFIPSTKTVVIYFIMSLLIGFMGLKRHGGFIRAFLLSIFLTPIIGSILTYGAGKEYPKGCLHCDNDKNEAEYCGKCGKNEAGELKEIST